MKRFWWLLVLISFLVILDQVTKAMIDTSFQLGESQEIIKNFFSITHVQNTGAVWGLGQNLSGWMHKFVMLFIPCLVVFYVGYLFLHSLKDSFWESLAYSLVISGAIGNLIDRFYLGYVVDFLDFDLGFIRWATFNVADVCVSLAMMILVGLEIRNFITKKKLQNV